MPRPSRWRRPQVALRRHRRAAPGHLRPSDAVDGPAPGLDDFHLCCQSICHWNLPSNPVDLEQREGRVNRCKCHGIHRNVARDLGLAVLAGPPDADPWRSLFRAAEQRRPREQTDRVACWVHDGPTAVRIQRHVPMLPLHGKTHRPPALKRRLAAYRMVCGQPRRDDLLEYILSRLDWSIELMHCVTARST